MPAINHNPIFLPTRDNPSKMWNLLVRFQISPLGPERKWVWSQGFRAKPPSSTDGTTENQLRTEDRRPSMVFGRELRSRVPVVPTVSTSVRVKKPRTLSKNQTW